ncbi:hypothetical protein CAAN1_08S04016 [[Candida] anglica]|uniref:Uncharacterized protein n=1 Tax=[Candida] anglica TaxID=148631 RepID=A0ABP0E5P8_9ASCO
MGDKMDLDESIEHEVPQYGFPGDSTPSFGQIKTPNQQPSEVFDSHHDIQTDTINNTYRAPGKITPTPIDVSTVSSLSSNAIGSGGPGPASDLRFLSSANFSSDSLPGTPPTPSNNTMAFAAPMSASSSWRGLSNPSLANSPMLGNMRTSPTGPIGGSAANGNGPNGRSARPKSAIFMMDSNSFAIAEDGSPVQEAIDNTPRARRSFHFGAGSSSMANFGGALPSNSSAARSYTPVVPMAPPMGPSGSQGAPSISFAQLGGPTPPRPGRRGSANSSAASSRSTSPVRSRSPVRHQHSRKQSMSPIRKNNLSIGGGGAGGAAAGASASPFNFKPLHHDSSSSISLKPAQRKGHKYKHSSVSMNFFQEPPPALLNSYNQPLSIPASFPIPTFRESLTSVKPPQRVKLLWSGFHLSLSIAVFCLGIHLGLPTLSTLAHLVFYDALGSFVTVFVDVMSNFDVWGSSSLQYPFGLGRLEVLVGFALSTSLVMVGLDLVSHGLEEWVVEMMGDEVVEAVATEKVMDAVGDATAAVAAAAAAAGAATASHGDSSHHIHHSSTPTHFTLFQYTIYLSTLLLVIITTFISSNYVLLHDRIAAIVQANHQQQSDVIAPPKKRGYGLLTGKNTSKGNGLDSESQSGTNSSSVTGLKAITAYLVSFSRNPTQFLTLAYSLLLVILPLLPELDLNVDLNESTTLVVALLLIYNGWSLAKTLGGILLLSYPSSDYQYYLLKQRLVDSITQLESYRQSYTMSRLFVTKVNYELLVVGVRMNMKGASSDDEARIRFEVTRIIRSEVEEAAKNGRNNKVEITLDIER